MKKRKILSLLLSLCLLIGLLPTVAMAADQVATESGVRITEANYDSTNNILTINVDIKMPNSTGIKSVGSLISYDSSKLTLLHKTKNDTTYTPSDPRTSVKPSVVVKLTNSDDELYSTDGGVDLYGTGNRAGLFVGLGTTGQPSDEQKTTDWLTIYQLRFKVSGKAADVLNSDSLRIADPAVDNDVIKGAYLANNKFVISVDSGDSIGYKYGKMKGYTGGDVGGNNFVMNPTNVTATYPGSTNPVTPPATKTLNSIAVTTAPTKTTYTAGENFDPTGMVVTATYSDSSTADVTSYTVTDGNNLTAGKTTVTISYTEGSETKTCTQTITVNTVTPPAPATLTGIKVKTAPTKLIYNEGESFDKTGMVIEATYSDSSKKDVTTYTYTPTGALTTSDTTITISYTEGSETKTCTQTITVNAAPPAPTEYTITFNGNGGTPSVGTMSTAGGKLTSLPTATRSGSYSFDGWYTAASGGTQITTAYVFSANTTVYAHWTYNGGGGSYYAPVVPDMPMLYRGCTGDAVKTLQDKLNTLGYNSGNVDGIFGAKTYAAVTAFQKANGLGVDGIVGKLTWGKIYGVSPAMPVETTTVVGRPMVSYGSRGDAVRKLQELLNALGYDCGSVDGIFGSKTKAAVLAFQKANGLGADGIVGPLTWAKLG